MPTPLQFLAPRDPSVESGHEALGRGALEDAQASFREAIARAESGEAHEGLAVSTWYLGDADAAVKAFERAYEQYQSRGDRVSAARVATALAVQAELVYGRSAVASGWLQRARRHLEGIPEAPEHAWLAAWEAHLALL